MAFILLISSLLVLQTLALEPQFLVGSDFDWKDADRVDIFNQLDDSLLKSRDIHYSSSNTLAKESHLTQCLTFSGGSNNNANDNNNFQENNKASASPLFFVSLDGIYSWDLNTLHPHAPSTIATIPGLTTYAIHSLGLVGFRSDGSNTFLRKVEATEPSNPGSGFVR